jgi:methylisocitrate lyase
VVLISMVHTPEQLRAIGERLGGPLMYLTRRGGLAGLGMSLEELGSLGYRIVADPSTPLMAAYTAWRNVYSALADGFGARSAASGEYESVEGEVHQVIGLERLLEIERETVEA